MKLFQYSILYTAPLTKEDKDSGKRENTIILKDVTSVLASDEQQAMLKVARDIPSDYMDKLDRVVIAIRPF